MRISIVETDEFAAARALGTLVVGEGELWSAIVDALDRDEAHPGEPAAAT
ncbi:MAG: hypothetical protein M3Y46_12550 [Actinomycetota bacterium]|jgi:hypothetical protein|nr:hypothetical protein [Actinomycetota bacterium]